VAEIFQGGNLFIQFSGYIRFENKLPEEMVSAPKKCCQSCKQEKNNWLLIGHEQTGMLFSRLSCLSQ
jgi:hypothetical protein